MNNHYHLIGIGGIGMGGLASLLVDKGFHVTGSDLRESKMTQKLKKQGVNISLGHRAENIHEAEEIIFSSAIRDDNPEITAARTKGIPCVQRAKFLADFMKNYCGITVVGAHGKTTTTSMIAHLFVKAKKHPTIAIGGIINSLSTNAVLGQGEYFVAELDESDGSFLYFSPQHSVITNIDLEHVDYYPDIATMVGAFKKFIQETSPNSTITACGEDEQLMKLIANSPCPVRRYGFSDKHDIYAQNIESDGWTSHFDCFADGKNCGRIALKIPGKHNVLNALACIAVGLKEGIPIETIIDSFEDYRGVQRRFQLKGVIGRDIRVVDDYAHHPTEIAHTLATARSLNPKRVITIIQPHRYSRLKAFWNEFAESLSNSDQVIVTDIYAASEEPIDGVTAQAFTEFAKEKRTQAIYYVPKEKIIDHVLNIVKPGDMILTLGAGDITRVADELVKEPSLL